jgi:hypothetical protein
MAKFAMTLQGAGLGAVPDKCKCVFNPRTKRSGLLCFVGKSKRTRSGWIFQKGGAQHCRR